MLRVLPFLIVCLLMLGFSKIMTVFDNFPQPFSISEPMAQDANEEKKEEGEKPKEESEKKEEGHNKEEGDDKKDPKVSKTPPPKKKECPKQFTPIELEVLESLTKRREELDKREKEISLKENVFKIIEKTIDQKAFKLEQLQKEAKAILEKYEEKQNQEIMTLVKIYENMKPKDAARIFDELQMPILVEVTSKMKEAKLALILASMNSEHAKDLTIELANRRKINLDGYSN